MTKPPDDRQRLASLFNVSRETLERLDLFETLLRQRSPTLSLVGRATLDEVWHRHFLDSAQLLPLIDPNNGVIDIGTGAGFPGMVLAIMGLKNMHLVENNQQKVAFLRDVATATHTDVAIHNVKVEALSLEGTALVLSRALAPLNRLLSLGERFFLSHADGLFLKGRKADEEIDDARKDWDFNLERYPSITSTESSILRLKRIRRKV